MIEDAEPSSHRAHPRRSIVLRLAMAAAALVLASPKALAQRSPGAGRGTAAPVVTLADVKVERMNERIAAVGSARARQQVTLTTRVAGVIAEVLFEGGQLVEANQPLVQSTTSLKASR